MNFLMVHNRYLIRGGEDECFESEGALLREKGNSVVEYIQDNQRIVKLGGIATALRTIWSGETFREIDRLLSNDPCDLVSVHNFFPLISPAVFYAARKHHTPVVWTLHNYRFFCLNGLCFRDGDVCERCLGKSFPWPGVRYACYRNSRAGSFVVACMVAFHRLIKTWSRKVDAFIVLTDFARGKFIQAGLPAEKIFIKPNFVLPDPGLGSGDGGYALFVGRLSEEKGVHLLLETWRRLEASLPLWIVGDGPLTEEVLQAAQTDKRIRYCGRLPHDETMKIMQSASFLIFPSSWYEGMPRTIIEAFAAGLPVLCNDLGAMHCMVVDGKNGLFFQRNSVNDLEDKIKGLVDHPDTLAEMRYSARHTFEENYTAQISYQKWLELMDLIAERKKAAS